ncbi:MAG TPA: hypothetical protein VKE74_29580 [Gemmataceae bacterium]|nr:hypothetical protein [Gemmataceae bacterium]
MVARNRHEGGGNPGGRDDLPPRVRDRLRPRLGPEDDAPALGHRPAPPGRLARFGWVRDLGRLALLFLLVAVGNVLVLLLALWIVGAGNPNPAVPLLDPFPAR